MLRPLFALPLEEAQKRNLTQEQRGEITRKATQARWAKAKKQQPGSCNVASLRIRKRAESGDLSRFRF